MPRGWGGGRAGACLPSCRPDGWDRAGGSSALCRRSGRGVCDSRVNEGSAPLPGRPAWLICALVFAAADEERGGFSAAGERGSPRPEALAAFGSQWAAPAALGSRLCSQSALGQAPFGPCRGSGRRGQWEWRCLAWLGLMRLLGVDPSLSLAGADPEGAEGAARAVGRGADGALTPGGGRGAGGRGQLGLRCFPFLSPEFSGGIAAPGITFQDI